MADTSKFVISGFYDEISSDLQTQIDVVKELSEGYMCPRSINGKNISAYSVEEFERDIKPLLDNSGIRFSSIGSPIGKIGLYDDEAFESQKKKLANLIKIAQLMDCKYIRVFSFFVNKKGDYSEYFPVVVKKLKEFIKIAEGSGVVLLHENEKKIYGDTPERCLQLAKELFCDSFKLAFDSSNYIQCKCEPYAAYEMLKDYTVYYHVKDCSPEGVEVPLGMGDGRYPEILADLVKRGYEGFITMEPHTLKYALTKRLFFFLPIAYLIPPIRYYRRVFKRIDKNLGKGRLQSVGRKEIFVVQYTALKKMLADIEAKA